MYTELGLDRTSEFNARCFYVLAMQVTDQSSTISNGELLDRASRPTREQ